MAKKAARNLNLAVNGVALEDDVQNATLDVRQELPVVTALADTGPRRVTGNYDYSVSMDGAADFASGQSDATLFGLVGATTAAAVGYDPTGSTAAGTSDPHYDSTDMLLESYSLRAGIGNAVVFNAALQGNSALSRATS